MATYLPRYPMARRVIRALAGQVDALRVYVNDVQGYLPGERSFARPDWPNLPANVTLLYATEAGGVLSDLGKMYQPPRCGYHLTLDDDLRYPADYVARIVAGIERHDRAYVVGYDAHDVDASAASYYDGGCCNRTHPAQALDDDTPRHVIRTKSMAYHTDTVQFRLADMHAQHMLDLWCALRCQACAVGTVALQRPGDWLGVCPTPDASITQTYTDDDAAQTSLMQRTDWTHHTTGRAHAIR